MAVKAAQEVYAQSRVKPDEVDVVELHDCFSTNELITYEALVCCMRFSPVWITQLMIFVYVYMYMCS